MSEPSDVQLWERVRSGDPLAFGDLYERHVRAVQSYCLWQRADPRQAEDATAVTFLEVWRQRERLRLTTASAVPLLLGIATNVLRQQRRARRRHAAALERLRTATPAAGPGHEEETIARLDAARELRAASAAVRALPRREREVLILIAWAELSYEEAAAALAVPVGTVRSRLSRARARLGEARLRPLSANTPREESQR